MQSNNQKVVELFNMDGSVSKYKKLSARLPEFLKRFPPEEGYSVTVESNDALSIKQGLLQLYKAAIKSGRSFEEVGLPPYKVENTIIFTARLRDGNNRILSERQAVKVVMDYKDFETGETSAVQRLLASVGFGGEIFDDDENRDFEDQSLETRLVSDTELINEEDSPVNTDENKETISTSDVDKKSTTGDEVPTSTIGSAEPKKAIEGVTDMMIQQMEELSALKGVSIPKYRSLSGAKKALKFLQQA